VTTSAPIKVDVWSDIACPWCFIGKRKFELGAAEAGIPVEVEYHSFELAPDTPVDFDGSEQDYLAARGFPAEQIPQMLARVTGIAETVGLHYDYDALKHTNTVKAHQLVHWAKAQGHQLEMTERLLAAYFEEGRHVGRDEDLADLAAEIGLDRAEALAALAEDRYLDDVRADQALAQQLGIQGVPFFVFEGQYGVSGAQDPATFADVLRQVDQKRSEVPA
jgi:predicted DsbA family dithiol-disulfide isomerase